MQWSGVRRKWVGTTVIMETIAAGVLSAISVMLVYSVIRRYVFRDPAANLNDWIGLLTVPGAMFALAHADVRSSHIRVELMQSLLRGMPRRIMETIAIGLSSLLALAVAYAMVRQGEVYRSSDTHTVQAHIGVWYGYWLLAASFLAFGIQLLLRAVETALGIESDSAYEPLEEVAEVLQDADQEYTE